MSNYCKFLGFFLTVVLLSLPPAASAAPYTPTRDLTIVNVSSPGGGSDVAIRALVKVITDLKLCPVNILVEYRTGGGGAVGYNYVAKKKGDVNIMAKISASYITSPLMGQSPVSYKDFTNVAGLVQEAYVVLVKNDSPIKNMADIKTKGTITTGATSTVSEPVILAHKIRDALGIKVNVVPYKGSGEYLSALLGGHIDVMFASPSNTLALIKDGEVRAVAVSSAQRLEALPAVPTLQEEGVNAVVTQLRGFSMPKGVPQEVVAYWTDIIRKATESPNWKAEYLDRYNAIPAYMTPEELEKDIVARNNDYAELIKNLGLKK